MMRLQPLLVAVLAFSLGGCTTIRDYCRERAALCVAASAVIVAGAVLAAQEDGGGSSSP
ncbi:MAG: hypothetical protein ACKOBM_17950 [Gammaproteobacteria bacterium]